jgi:hypothetical protein
MSSDDIVRQNGSEHKADLPHPPGPFSPLKAGEKGE